MSSATCGKYDDMSPKLDEYGVFYCNTGGAGVVRVDTRIGGDDINAWVTSVNTFGSKVVDHNPYRNELLVVKKSMSARGNECFVLDADTGVKKSGSWELRGGRWYKARWFIRNTFSSPHGDPQNNAPYFKNDPIIKPAGTVGGDEAGRKSYWKYQNMKTSRLLFFVVLLAFASGLKAQVIVEQGTRGK